MIEEWKNIKGYEGLYQVSNLGRVKSLSRTIGYNHAVTGERFKRVAKERIIKGGNCRGYASINLNKNGVGKTHRLCRLVAIAFIDNPEKKPCVNHIDGNKRNDMVDNLEWCTYQENMVHAKENGLIKYYVGKDHSASIKVIDTKTNKIFDTINEAAIYIGISAGQLSRKLRGIYKNETTLKIWQGA